MGFNFNSIWLTVLLLSITVVIHEFGHFISARAFGVTVYEFSVGFGPLIGKFTRKGVQYSLRWILFGGFCKIAGMDMALEGETKDPETNPEHLFFNLGLWKKIIILAAGSVLNLFAALIIIFFTFIVIGLPTGIESINIDKFAPKSPALEAGLQRGDKLVSINNQKIENTSDVSKSVQQSQGRPLEVTISRNGELIVKEITPYYNQESKSYMIGVVMGIVPKFETASWSKAFKMTMEFPGNTIKMLVLIFRGKLKGGLVGPVGMVDMIDQTMSLPFKFFLFNLLFFAGSIGISLFLFNMLPIPLPILDGGWIVILILERIFRREFSAEQKAAAYTIGLIALFTATIWIIYGDMARLLKRLLGG